MNEEEGNIFHRLMICGIEFLEWALDRESSCELCAEIDCEEGVCVNKRPRTPICKRNTIFNDGRQSCSVIETGRITELRKNGPSQTKEIISDQSETVLLQMFPTGGPSRPS